MPGRKKTKLRYEHRVVLFLDLLGFKEHVAKTVRNPGYLANLLTAMEIVSKIGLEDRKFSRSQRVTQFSDSVVVSFGIDEKSAVFWLLHDIALSVIELAMRGFLVRGAVTVGDLLHTNSRVVGPAMVEAYEWESKRAVYPRVLINGSVLKIARKARSEDHTSREEEKYVRSFMTRDEDGYDYFDYVSWNSVIAIAGGLDKGYGPYLSRLALLVQEGLSAPDPRVIEKYLWLYRRYAAALEQFEALPAEHAYRRQSPENCSIIDGLDRMKRLAKTARRTVERSRLEKASAGKKKP